MCSFSVARAQSPSPAGAISRRAARKNPVLAHKQTPARPDLRGFGTTINFVDCYHYFFVILHRQIASSIAAVTN
jgi:hypothetical protein